MRNNLLKISVAFAALFIVLVFTETGNAQTRRGRVVSKQQVEQLLERIEERSDHFSNQLNKSLDRSRLDGGKAEDRIADRSRDLENATDELRREFDHNDSRGRNLKKREKISQCCGSCQSYNG